MKVLTNFANCTTDMVMSLQAGHGTIKQLFLGDWFIYGYMDITEFYFEVLNEDSIISKLYILKVKPFVLKQIN